MRTCTKVAYAALEVYATPTDSSLGFRKFEELVEIPVRMLP